MRALASFIYHRILGWKATGNTDLNHIKKAVIIAAPHTSWMDFPLGLLLRKVLGLQVNFVGKASLFRFPFGWFFRAVGGAPVQRHRSMKQVDVIAEIFNSRDEFRLAMSPEGTRKKVDTWRTGFYYIAKKAQVPIIMITLDFKAKENRISEPFMPTEDVEADFKYIRSFFKDAVGKIPEYS